jgi:hypothetical protein
MMAAGTGEFPLLGGQPATGSPRSAVDRFAQLLERALAGVAGPAVSDSDELTKRLET